MLDCLFTSLHLKEKNATFDPWDHYKGKIYGSASDPLKALIFRMFLWSQHCRSQATMKLGAAFGDDLAVEFFYKQNEN